VSSATDDPRRSLGVAILLVALTIALWVLQHPYAGIHHDAQLYTVQALARVNPAALSHDVFLRYGSQDSFTGFGPLYAAVIRALGVAGAAALLTFLSQCAFAGSALLLARCLLPGRLALIGAGLVCVMPLTYGAHKVFYVMEDFVTPRLLAQSLVLAGLAALLTRRYKLALLAGALATLLHPVMALTGCLVGVFLDTVDRRWRRAVLAAAGVAVLAFAMLLAARGLPLRFDEEWWPLVHDGLPYLFPLEWRKFDWARVIVLATFLYAGARRLPEGSARMLCRATLAVSTAALVLTILGADVLRLVAVTQLQPWRVLWLASALALMLTPLVMPALWRSGNAGRIALVAMLCAFLLADERFALSAALVSGAVLLLGERVSAESPMLRPVLMGLYALLALSLLINLASSAILARAGIDQDVVPRWLQALRSASATGVLPALALSAAGWAASRAPHAVLSAAALGSLLVAAALVGAALPQWLQSPFTEAARASFSAWRERIPAGAEVLWFTSPVAAWVVLERPSYVSVQQTASSLFSREAAMVLRDRMNAVPDFLRSADLGPWRPATGEERSGQGTLSNACEATHTGFIVTRKDLERAPIAVTDAALPEALRGWKLYACGRGSAP
jgi:hypothetical protein